MSQPPCYDQALLDEAPVATRAQREEGYNVDLLDTRPSRPISTQPLSPPPQLVTHRDTDVESSPQEKFVPGAAMYAQKPTQSFWRTRNGKITILIVVVLALGAMIGGGAVGGIVTKKSSNDNSNPPPSSLTSGTSTTPRTSTAVIATSGLGEGVNSGGQGGSSTTSTSSFTLSSASSIASSGAPTVPSAVG